jgi:hypothetical protein
MPLQCVLLCRVVAASNVRKYDETFVPLQDNVALTAKNLMSRSSWVSFILQWHWAHIGNFLFCFLALPFSVLWDQVRSTFSIQGKLAADCTCKFSQF